MNNGKIDLFGGTQVKAKSNFTCELVMDKDMQVPVKAGSVVVVIPDVATQFQTAQLSEKGNRVINVFSNMTGVLRFSGNLILKA